MVRPFNPVTSQSSFFLAVPLSRTPHPPPSAATLMATAASSSSATTKRFLYPPIIPFHCIFIREYLINCITIICDRGVGRGHGDNSHLNLYGRLHGSDKVGMDIFIKQTQLRFVSVNLTAWILINNHKCISQPDLGLFPPHVGIIFDWIKQLLNIVLGCW